MLKSITDRNHYSSPMEWARAEYAAIQQSRHELYPGRQISLEPGPKSALFARLLAGKFPLAFAPPLSFSQPWYELIEEPGPFSVLLGGMLPVTKVRLPEYGDCYLSYLVLNDFPWGVAESNEAAAVMLKQLEAIHDGLASIGDSATQDTLRECLRQRPEWVVNFPPWPSFKLRLGRAVRQGRRGEIQTEGIADGFLDAAETRIGRIVIDGKSQAESRAERVAPLRVKPAHLLSPAEMRALAESDHILADPEKLDVVEYECDTWMLERISN